MDKDRITLDALCFGAHPDDVEIGMAGSIIKWTQAGKKIGICDLTLAELSSNGTVTERQEEAEAASRILGTAVRLNLGFPDRGLEKSKEAISLITKTIRKYRPKTIFLPVEQDRHPDHGQTTRLVEEGIFNAGIHKYELTGEPLAAFRPDKVIYYQINAHEKPQLIVDVTDVYEQKLEALLAYKSQFVKHEQGVETRLNRAFLEVIKSRDIWVGHLKGYQYAEGFLIKEPLALDILE